MSRTDSNDRANLEEAVLAFAGISESLQESYEQLTQRADHVEQELVRTNAELQNKLAELDATRSHLEAILEALPTGVIVRDFDGSITAANQAAVKILEIPEQELLGEYETPLVGPESVEGTPRETLRPSGSRLVVASRRSSVNDAHGDCLGSVEILDDQTEISLLSERLHRADKMAALGTMAGGIAHEIRNPMNAIKGFAGLMGRELDPTSKLGRWAKTISAGVDEVDLIVSGMLTLAHPERLQVETIDLAELIREAIEAARCAASDNTDHPRWTITSRLDVETACGDRIKLRQALRNLIANALQAQPGGGSVLVHAHSDGKELLFSVHDDGSGIPRDIRHLISDPFFTTRAEGTGLGLALVHTIAQLHGGRLEITDDQSPCHELRGACLTIRIPTLQPSS